LIGVAGAAISSTCFGFSRSLPAMLLARSIAGGLSGNAAVISSMLGEITDETNQGKGGRIKCSSRGLARIYLCSQHFLCLGPLGPSALLCMLRRLISIRHICSLSPAHSRGPMIGGNLSNPARKWPEVFKNYPLFHAYARPSGLRLSRKQCTLTRLLPTALLTSMPGILLNIHLRNYHVWTFYS
jgi:hypothetical protein